MLSPVNASSCSLVAGVRRIQLKKEIKAVRAIKRIKLFASEIRRNSRRSRNVARRKEDDKDQTRCGRKVVQEATAQRLIKPGHSAQTLPPKMPFRLKLVVPGPQTSDESDGISGRTDTIKERESLSNWLKLTPSPFCFLNVLTATIG